ncbi:3370_t:CDS:2 [Ambispora leptoticha]|uniref:3370_t:CDS:1 n=1 Tax=Ambispora leptoticha TaxID=144679 RepID=A0A9N9EWW6_9GLOM|nr:3370_t:CDS:2 [Ambispora leptoticha]
MDEELIQKQQKYEDDPFNSNLKNEMFVTESKRRMIANETAVEEIVRERSINLFKNKCRLFRIPPNFRDNNAEIQSKTELKVANAATTNVTSLTQGNKKSEETTSVEFAEPSHENDKEISRRKFKKWTKEDEETLRRAVDNHGKDWEKISENYFDSGRSPASIYEKFCKGLKGSNLTYIKWTPEEDQKLEEGVAKLGVGNWQDIRKEFLPNRNGQQILGRWKIISSTKRGNWTPEEDEALQEFVRKNGCKWSLASKVFKRPYLRIFERWDRYLAPGLKRGTWTEEELEILRNSIKKFGKDWDKIKEALPHRSLYFIKQKYRNSPSVRPEFKKGTWGVDEELALVEAVKKCGKRWNDVSNMIGTRSPDQCCSYYCKTLLSKLSLFTFSLYYGHKHIKGKERNGRRGTGEDSSKYH